MLTVNAVIVTVENVKVLSVDWTQQHTLNFVFYIRFYLFLVQFVALIFRTPEAQEDVNKTILNQPYSLCLSDSRKTVERMKGITDEPQYSVSLLDGGTALSDVINNRINEQTLVRSSSNNTRFIKTLYLLLNKVESGPLVGFFS